MQKAEGNGQQELCTCAAAAGHAGHRGGGKTQRRLGFFGSHSFDSRSVRLCGQEGRRFVDRSTCHWRRDICTSAFQERFVRRCKTPRQQCFTKHHGDIGDAKYCHYTDKPFGYVSEHFSARADRACSRSGRRYRHTADSGRSRQFTGSDWDNGSFCKCDRQGRFTDRRFCT